MTTATLQTSAPFTGEQPAESREAAIDVHAVTVRRTDEPAPWTGRSPSWVWQCSQACYGPDGVAHNRPGQALSHALTHAAVRLHLFVEPDRLERFYATVLAHEQLLTEDNPDAAAGIQIDTALLTVHRCREDAALLTPTKGVI